MMLLFKHNNICPLLDPSVAELNAYSNVEMLIGRTQNSGLAPGLDFSGYWSGAVSGELSLSPPQLTTYTRLSAICRCSNR